MPVTFRWNRVREARVEDSINNLAVMRGALAKGLDRSAPALTILKVLEDAGMPAIGDEYDATYPDLICTGRIVWGEAWDLANVQVKYETKSANFTFFPTTNWYVRDDTAVTQEQTQISVSGVPIVVNYKPPGAANARKDYPFFSKFMPLRSLVLQATLNTRPSATVLDAVGTVNSATWQGYPKGYWLCTGCGAEASSVAPNQLRVSASFLSKVHFDWKSYASFVDETGRVPSDIVPADVADVINADYTTSSIHTANGFVGVGLYAMSDFGSIFGGT